MQFSAKRCAGFIKRISLRAGARLGIAAAILAFPMLTSAVEPTDLDGMKTANGKIVEYWDTHGPLPDGQVGKQW